MTVLVTEFGAEQAVLLYLQATWNYFLCIYFYFRILFTCHIYIVSLYTIHGVFHVYVSLLYFFTLNLYTYALLFVLLC